MKPIKLTISPCDFEVIEIDPKIIEEVDKEFGITEKDKKEMSKMWCECENDFGESYADNGKCNCGIHKHHYHCLRCGKIKQIG